MRSGSDRVYSAPYLSRRFLCRLSNRHPFHLASCPNHEGAGHHPGPHPVRRPLRAPRHPMAMGDAANHQRISAEDHAGKLRLHRQVSALRLQLDRLQPLPHDEGVLPGRLRQADAVCQRGPLVSRRLLGRRRRREPAQRRRNLPPDSLRQRVLPKRFRQGERRVHAARLLRISRLAAQHPRARRGEGILHPEAQRRLAAGAANRRPRFARANPRRHPLQRWPLDWPGRQERHRGFESRRLWQQRLHRSQQGSRVAATAALPDR